MFRSKRAARCVAVLGAAAAATVAGLAGASPAAAAPRGHAAGVVGDPIMLAHVGSFSGYDVAADASGTAYIGWISTSNADGAVRQVHLCRLPVGATSCTGGVQTIDSPNAETAAGLQVVLTGTHLVHLIWFHDTDASVSGPRGGEIAEATAADGKHLTQSHDVADAPSFGELLTAVPGPHGSIWTVTYSGLPARHVEVREGLSAPFTSVHTPFVVGFAQVAFTHGKPVMAVERYASIGASPHWATTSSNGKWGAFHTIAHTWAVGTNAALATSGHGLRLVTSVNDASYRPVLSKWTGSGFSPRKLTADHNNCRPASHDGVTDGSGRFLDVGWECEDLTITNYADGDHAGIVRFGVKKTPTAVPQIASGVRGIATVAYSTQTTVGQVLMAAHVRLPGTTRTVSHQGAGGRVTVTGPRSCLPPVNVHIGWTHHAAHKWSFRSGDLRLDGKAVSGGTLDGAALPAGQKFTLAGSAVFGNGSRRSTVKAVLDFRTCASG